MMFENLQRVETQHGSHIEPRLEDSWDDLTKLQWQAAVTYADSGVRINVIEGGLREKRFGVWREVRGQYSYSARNHSGGTMGFHSMWTFLNGISLGARLTRSEATS